MSGLLPVCMELGSLARIGHRSFFYFISQYALCLTTASIQQELVMGANPMAMGRICGWVELGMSLFSLFSI